MAILKTAIAAIMYLYYITEWLIAHGLAAIERIVPRNSTELSRLYQYNEDMTMYIV